MADKVRREKDLIRRTVDRYLETTSQDYIRYFEGSPAYITYYRLDDIATKQDSSLENVHSLIGKNTPNEYQKISDVVVYGVDTLDITNEINEKGLESLINGEFVLLPDSVKPYPGDFFVFDDPNLEDHLFRVDNVQFDRASPKKFYRVSYAIYPDNPDLIFDNVSTEHVLMYDNMGGKEIAILNKADVEVAERAKGLIDGLIDKFTLLFYDEDMDMFVYRTNHHIKPGEDLGVWSPYLQKFIHNNKLVEKYANEILIEFYTNDMNQSNNPEFFSNFGYRNSIFRKLETQDKNLTFANSFMSVIEAGLQETRNLPFFESAVDFQMANIHSTNAFYKEAFYFLTQDFTEIFDTWPAYKKFKGFDDLEDNTESLSVGDIVYQLSETSNLQEPITQTPIQISQILSKDGGISLIDLGFNELMNDDSTEVHQFIEDNLPLFNIIKKYLLGTLHLNDDLIKQMNDYQFEIEFKSYIMMPIIVFILKDLINSASS